MLTEKDYCDYDTCVALIEMGFVGTSRYYYDKKNHKLHITNYGITYTVRTALASEYILAIHLYDAQKWLREEKGIIVEVVVDDNSDTPITYNIHKDGECICHHHGRYWSVRDWDVALSEGIKEAIKILQND